MSLENIKLTFTLLLALTLCACQADTVQVTRIQVMERRVIERVVVTVEVTRLQPVTVTPRPTRVQRATPTPDATAEPSPIPTSTPAASPSTRAPSTPTSSARAMGESLLAALTDMEQTLLALVPALNSQPLPTENVIQLYDALRNAPIFDIPENKADLLSIYLRYRQQVEYVPDQGNDLYLHLTKIQSGEADQTGISAIHLSLAQDAASTGTSTIQGLIRELEAYLASLP